MVSSVPAATVTERDAALLITCIRMYISIIIIIIIISSSSIVTMTFIYIYIYREICGVKPVSDAQRRKWHSMHFTGLAMLFVDLSLSLSLSPSPFLSHTERCQPNMPI